MPKVVAGADSALDSPVILHGEVVVAAGTLFLKTKKVVAVPLLPPLRILQRREASSASFCSGCFLFFMRMLTSGTGRGGRVL